ncbi:VanW family protein [Streptomyces sp. NRRL S-87]|uniref:VanW family protein n=1 Tax=Streptomyces sp. NRRL S-87 TaxID=1463920 RepID=UPI00068FAD8D|nr:VanW family protein [Streptomyces sp. NRRL S-87]
MRPVRRLMSNWRTALPLAGGAAVLGFGGLYGAGLLMAGDAIADGTHVRGVDIGGMSRTQAGAALERGLGKAAVAPLSLRIGDRTEQVSPTAFGLSFDPEATARSAEPAGKGPFDVIGRLFAGSEDREVEPVVRMDATATRATVERLSAAGPQPRNGSISFAAGAPRVTAPVTGVTVRDGQVAQVVRTAYLNPRTAPVALPVNQTPPAADAGETERALREIARPAMSGRVVLKVAGTSSSISLSPEVIGKHLTVEADAQGRLVPKLDAKGLLADPSVTRQLAAVGPGPSAGFRVDSAGRAVVTEEGRAGTVRVTPEQLRDAVVPLLTRTGAAARTGQLQATVVSPRLTVAEAEALGIKERMSSFTVHFPPAPYRITNIHRAVELINGSVVRPGETWSFNDTVGERTKEHGFVDGIMINDGQYTKSPGGGVSAVATTMYNAVFFAGVHPVEHGAHSFYIERYPEGREATVAWGTLDLRWKNDSGHPVYVKAESTDSSVTISLLGTKKYDEVRATKGPRENVVPPGKRTGTLPDCEVQTPLEGFDVNVGRVFVQDGKEVGRETFRTHYTPRDEVTCTPAAPSGSPTPGTGATGTPPAPAPAAAPEAGTTAAAPATR